MAERPKDTKILKEPPTSAGSVEALNSPGKVGEDGSALSKIDAGYPWE